MSHVMDRVQTLETLQCGECGVLFAVPQGFLVERRETGKSWYCPNGHGRVFRESDVDRLKRQLDSANALARHYCDQQEAAERSNVALRGHITRHKKRAAAGVCPVTGCKRHFKNVQAHIERQHPGYAAEVIHA